MSSDAPDGGARVSPAIEEIHTDVAAGPAHRARRSVGSPPRRRLIGGGIALLAGMAASAAGTAHAAPGDGVPAGGAASPRPASGSPAGGQGASSDPPTALHIAGDLVVDGSLIVAGQHTQATLVRGKDGASRRVYGVEAAEAWLTDFGTAQLTGGRADVRLDASFAALVSTPDYLVFLTPMGGIANSLAVAARRDASFSVVETGGGASTGDFAYLLVAKRADVTSRRLERAEAPPRSRQAEDLANTKAPPAAKPIARGPAILPPKLDQADREPPKPVQ